MLTRLSRFFAAGFAPKIYPNRKQFPPAAVVKSRWRATGGYSGNAHQRRIARRSMPGFRIAQV